MRERERESEREKESERVNGKTGENNQQMVHKCNYTPSFTNYIRCTRKPLQKRGRRTERRERKRERENERKRERERKRKKTNDGSTTG